MGAGGVRAAEGVAEYAPRKALMAANDVSLPGDDPVCFPDSTIEVKISAAAVDANATLAASADSMRGNKAGGSGDETEPQCGTDALGDAGDVAGLLREQRHQRGGLFGIRKP